MRCPRISELPAPPKAKTGWPWTSESSKTEDLRPDGLPWPKISIVTPSFNQAEFLEAAIRSVLLQGYPNIEYVIIDGKSTDSSLSIIKKYESWLSYFVSEPDNGQYDAINKGFSVTDGEIMSWLNSDDMYAPNCFKIAGQVFACLGNKVEWLSGVKMYWDGNGEICTIFEPPEFRRRLIRMGLYQGRILGWIQQEGTFWSRSLWNRAGGAVDTSIPDAADFALWRKFSKYTDLYTVRCVLGGNRHQYHQKTFVQTERYIKQIDENLQDAISRWIAKLMRNKYIRRLALLCQFLCRNNKKVICYDTRSKQWKINLYP